MKWTPELDAQLREAFAAGGIRAAVAALGVTVSAVKNRVQTLRLRSSLRAADAWQPGDDAKLREMYELEIPIEALEAAIGRPAGSVIARAKRLGLTRGRRYTEAEKAAVAEGFAAKGATELAREIFGNDGPMAVSRISHLASKLGVTSAVRHPAWVLDRVRELHGRGLNDVQIARELGDYFRKRHPREAVTAIRRRRLKLPAIRPTAEQMIATGRRTRQAQLAAGVNPRNQAYERLAARYGLPPDTAPRAVEIVLALVGGPKNRDQLREATGRDPTDQWNGRCTSYAGELIRRGLVASQAIPNHKHRGPRRVYFLTPAAMDLLARAGQGACQ